MRDGSCCGYNHPPNSCVKFIVTLDPAAQGITFNVIDGALPQNLEWQLMNPAQTDCDPTTYPAGVPVCLDDPGPHIIIFCKPGGNENTYSITSIQAPSVSGDIIVNDGCTDVIQTAGFDVPSLQYNSVYPGAPGAYNYLLSCSTGCASASVTGQAGLPAYVDYEVCGMPIGSCYAMEVCDTVRVYFNPSLTVNIAPQNPTICYGDNEASLTAHGNGGYPPYSFQWSTGDTSQTITVGVGNYSVTIHDASGCPPNSDNVTVSYYILPIIANAGPDQTICTNNLPVHISGSVNGASGGIWVGGNGIISPSNTSLNIDYTPTAQEISDGGFDLSLITTENSNCPGDTDSVHVTIFVFQASLIDSADVTCFGDNNGSATALAGAGTAPFTYDWSDGAHNANDTGLSGGTYFVTVTDAVGCFDILSVTISEPLPLIATITATITPCQANLGSATVNPSGGVPGYLYQWSDSASQTTQTATGLGAGFYTVTVTDASSCSEIFGISVDNEGPPYVAISDSVMVSCHGGSDGSATALITTAGVPPHTFLWSDALNQTTPVATGLSAGTYIVVVTDSLGCVGSDMVTITEPTAIFSTTSSQDISCFGFADGYAVVMPSGGNPPYTFLWSNSQVSASISGLTQGLYIVTITDQNLCQHIDSAIINMPLPLGVTISNINDVSCYGLSNGSASVSGINGTPPYSYSWSGGQSSQTITNLNPGTYQVTVTDHNNCTTSATITINEPAQLSIAGSVQNISCYGLTTGIVDITVSGGTTPYLYGWSNGQVTEDIIFVNAGNYSVTIVDANGCSSSQNFTISQPNDLVIYSSVNSISCYGQHDGSINNFVSGGTPPYTFSWSNSASTEDLVNLSQGAYSLTVTDANSCTASGTMIITEPALFTSTITFTTEFNGYSVQCYGDTVGFINLIVTGGVAPYEYLWSNNSTNIDLYNVGAGSYSVTVTDAHNCITTNDTVLTQPPQLIVTIDITDVSCYGGMNGGADLTVAGGLPAYSFIWSTTASTEDLTSVPAGIYYIQVTDSNNCSYLDSIIIDEPSLLVITCSPDTIICKNTQAIINTNVTGGVQPYDFYWNDSLGLDVLTISPSSDTTFNIYVQDANNCFSDSVIAAIHVFPPLNLSVSTTDDSVCIGSSTQITAVISGGYNNLNTLYYQNQVISSPYTITPVATQDWIFMAKDSCNVKAWDTITIYALPIPMITAINITDAFCHGQPSGSIDLTVAGGTPGYSFYWNPTGSTEDLLNVPAGTYYVQVIDANSCFTSDTMVIHEPPGMFITCSPDTIICKNSSVTINAFASGGQLPYIFYWNGTPGIDILTISPPSDTTFYIYVKDADNCTSDSVITNINTYPAVNLTISTPNDSVCIGNSTQIYATISGGYDGSALLYFQNQVVSSPYTVTPNTTHDWILMAKDSCNVEAFDTLTIFALPVPMITAVDVSDVLCHGESTGNIYLTISGGTPGFTYLWNSTASSKDLLNVPAGTYYVQVIDTNNCYTSDTMLVNEPSELLISCSQDTVICKGSQAVLSATANGGVLPYSYYWNGNPGFSILTVSTNSDTAFHIYVRDANGCNSDSVLTNIFTHPNVMLSLFTTTDSLCAGSAAQIYAVTSSGHGETSLFNNNMQMIQSPYTVYPNNTTDYILIARDSCGTKAYDTVTIHTMPVPTVSITANPYMGCEPLLVKFNCTTNPVCQNFYWNFGDEDEISFAINPEHLYQISGIFDINLTVTTPFGCNQSLLISDMITVHPKPEARFDYDPILPNILNPLVSFYNYSTEETMSVWSFGDGDSSGAIKPVHLYSRPGDYRVTLTVQNVYGCRDTAIADLKVKDEFTFYAPSAFSPDHNDINEYFSVYGYGINPSTFVLYIFDRWGEVIYTTTKLHAMADGGMYSEPWDGSVKRKILFAPNDIYTWLVQYKDIKGAFKQHAGAVTILR